VKITKRQLQRLIREEKNKLIKESFPESFEPLEDFGGGYEKPAASSKERMPDENIITMLLSTIALRMINGPESKAGYDLYNALMKELSDNGYSTDVDDLIESLS